MTAEKDQLAQRLRSTFDLLKNTHQASLEFTGEQIKSWLSILLLGSNSADVLASAGLKTPPVESSLGLGLTIVNPGLLSATVNGYLHRLRFGTSGAVVDITVLGGTRIGTLDITNLEVALDNINYGFTTKEIIVRPEIATLDDLGVDSKVRGLATKIIGGDRIDLHKVLDEQIGGEKSGLKINAELVKLMKANGITTKQIGWQVFKRGDDNLVRLDISSK
jgi:hypothetical protein